MKTKTLLADLSDGELWQLSRRGDDEAFLVLYRRHQGPVFRFALYMSGRRETAEEVTQEVFLAMLDRASRYQSDQGALQAWLIGTARNLIRTQMRKLAATGTLPSQKHSGRLSGSKDLVSALSREEELERLRTAILRLPENYHEAVVLCDLEELSYEQAALQLGCAVGTVRSRLHRARAILAARLRKHERCPV